MMELSLRELSEMSDAVNALEGILEPLTSQPSIESIRVIEAHTVMLNVITNLILAHPNYIAGSA